MTPEVLHCATALRRGDHDRFLTTLFAPAKARPGLLALFAFNLELARTPELVSEAQLGLIRLQWWRDQLEKPDGSHPVLAALAQAMQQHRLPAFAIKAMIDARQSDLEAHPFADDRALEGYAKASGGTLLELASVVLEEKGAARAAQYLGAAWTQIGILRAVPFHMSQGRVLLPQARLTDAALADLRQGGPALSQVIKDIAQLAKNKLIEAARDLPKSLRPHLILAERHLRTLEKAGWNPFDPRVARPSPGRIFALYKQRLLRRI